jgi:transcriptional regulator with PAS, ATPase and Fis domain
MENTHGGKREGAGRKPKADEVKAFSLASPHVEDAFRIIAEIMIDETKRPVHCTDAKREVMYVKDEDKWEKENESKQKIRKAIKHVAHKNSKMLKEFKTKHPDCDKSESKFSDQYNKLVIEALGGKGDNDLEKEDKIIKNIAKEVVIDKHGELI